MKEVIRNFRAAWDDGSWFERFALIVFLIAVTFMAAILLLAIAGFADARDLDGRYANSPNKEWFDSLKSGKGPCCSDADGTALADVDWESHDGHYRVRIEGEWVDVPEDAVLTGPNLVGKTMVWPVYYRAMGAPVRVEIRCFLKGVES